LYFGLDSFTSSDMAYIPPKIQRFFEDVENRLEKLENTHIREVVYPADVVQALIKEVAELQEKQRKTEERLETIEYWIIVFTQPRSMDCPANQRSGRWTREDGKLVWKLDPLPPAIAQKIEERSLPKEKPEEIYQRFTIGDLFKETAPKTETELAYAHRFDAEFVWCFSCKTNVVVKDSTTTWSAAGKSKRLQGTCAECGKRVSKFVL